MIQKKLAKFTPLFGILGEIKAPDGPSKYGQTAQGLFTFLGNLFRLGLVVASIYAIFQFIQAGYLYMSGDPKKIDQAWNKIYQTMIGLVIISAAFALVGIISYIVGTNLLNPTIYGPGTP